MTCVFIVTVIFCVYVVRARKMKEDFSWDFWFDTSLKTAHFDDQ